MKAYRAPVVPEGFKWICLEYNDYGNHARVHEYRAACEQEGLVFTIWLTRDFSAAQVREAAVVSQARGVLLEGEIPAMNYSARSAPLERGEIEDKMHAFSMGRSFAPVRGEVPNPQAVNWPEMVWALQDLPIHKGVVTNWSPFTHNNGTPYPELARPLIDAGWFFHTECYDMNGDPTGWIDQRAFFGTHLGVVHSNPAVGVYGGRTWASFPQLPNYRLWSVWAAEYLI